MTRFVKLGCSQSLQILQCPSTKKHYLTRIAVQQKGECLRQSPLYVGRVKSFAAKSASRVAKNAFLLKRSRAARSRAARAARPGKTRTARAAGRCSPERWRRSLRASRFRRYAPSTTRPLSTRGRGHTPPPRRRTCTSERTPDTRKNPPVIRREP